MTITVAKAIRAVEKHIAICDSATPQPWEADREAGMGFLIHPIGALVNDSYERYESDAVFITAARAGYRATLEYLRRRLTPYNGGTLENLFLYDLFDDGLALHEVPVLITYLDSIEPGWDNQ